LQPFPVLPPYPINIGKFFHANKNIGLTAPIYAVYVLGYFTLKNPDQHVNIFFSFPLSDKSKREPAPVSPSTERIDGRGRCRIMAEKPLRPLRI
jgi:hypothetical protein